MVLTASHKAPVFTSFAMNMSSNSTSTILAGAGNHFAGLLLDVFVIVIIIGMALFLVRLGYNCYFHEDLLDIFKLKDYKQVPMGGSDKAAVEQPTVQPVPPLIPMNQAGMYPPGMYPQGVPTRFAPQGAYPVQTLHGIY